jgi:hypothetical protein
MSNKLLRLIEITDMIKMYQDHLDDVVGMISDYSDDDMLYTIADSLSKSIRGLEKTYKILMLDY